MCSESLWKKETALPRFETLRGGIRTGVLIIGGGLAGLLCAYFLDKAGVDYVLAEAKTICSGVTGNTTAKISSQHGLIYAGLLRRFGAEKARMYYEANQAALERYRDLCADIDCGFEERDSYVYSLDGEEKLCRELEALQRIGAEAAFAETLSLPFPTAGAVRFPKQAQFDPLRFASAIAEGLKIYEHSPIREVGDGFAAADGGKIRADKIIVCTHFPFINRHGFYYLKLCQNRSYAAAFQGARDVGGMYLDESGKGLSFRSFGDKLILGGGAHRTGKATGGWSSIEDFARRHYPGAKEVCRWAAQDCMSLDGVPYIGPYSASAHGLYVATGFNKWGMTGSMAAAELLTDLALGRDNPYAELFSPSRSILHPRLAVNGFEAVTGWLTPTAKRCPHLGCALKWNGQEHSWDCPCHGSRFTYRGERISGPAQQDAGSGPG